MPAPITLKPEVPVSALPYPKYSLDRLYLYPYYPTREYYERTTGRACPPWDKSRRPKKWFAPEAIDSPEDFVIFDRVLATDMKGNGRAVAGPDGKPYAKSLILPKEIAATVNIPPNATNVEGADVPEYPCPFRPLEPNEELFFDPAGLGAVAVMNTDLYTIEGFTSQDRAVLQAIARKLGA